MATVLRVRLAILVLSVAIVTGYRDGIEDEVDLTTDHGQERALRMFVDPFAVTSTDLTYACVALVLIALAVGIASQVDGGKHSAYSKCLAEFLGTFVLVFTVGCNDDVGDGTIPAVASIACTLMVLIYALAGISGANLNPAVSVALGLSDKLPWPDVAMYVFAQLGAGIAAGLAYSFMFFKQHVPDLGPEDSKFSLLNAGFAELLYTFLLTFVVLNVAASKKHAGKNQFYGLAIGFSVIAAGYGGGVISGACLNPAVALGIEAGASTSMYFAAYTGFELVGCALAAGLFRVCRPDDFAEDDISEYSLTTKLVSEFIGTYMLVLTVGLNILGGSKAAVFSISSSLMCTIFALGTCSGAHFNPAVTWAITLSGRDIIDAPTAAAYVCVQIIGGTAAGWSSMAMYNMEKRIPFDPVREELFTENVTFMQAMVGEVLFTFLLSYVVLCVATVKSNLSEFFGLAIGCCVTAGGLAIGNLSGASLNPGVSLGLAFCSSDRQIYEHGFFYSLAELVGGSAAAATFMCTHAIEYFEGNPKGSSASSSTEKLGEKTQPPVKVEEQTEKTESSEQVKEKTEPSSSEGA